MFERILSDTFSNFGVRLIVPAIAYIHMVQYMELLVLLVKNVKVI